MTVSVLKTQVETQTGPNAMLAKDVRDELSQAVLRILSGSYVLMIKTQAVHWNITGPLFKSVHDLTEDQYTDLFEAIDVLAERIRALGIKAPMGYDQMQDGTDLKPFDADNLAADQMIAALAADHELLATEMAAGVKIASEFGDPATEDLFTERLRIHQKHAWMLRAMLDQ